VTPPAAPRPAPAARRGFTLVELVIAVSILVVLSGIVAPTVHHRLARSRDARRMADVQAVVGAIEDYLYDEGELPDHDPERGTGGWDTSLDGAFISALVEGGYLRQHVVDPLNDGEHHLRYHHYPAGYEGFTSDFFVLGVVLFALYGWANDAR